MFDINFIRQQFPALNGEWIFLDNAGGSQILGSIVERISDYLIHTNVQLGASYGISQQSTQRVEEARQLMATFINAKSPDEVIFGSSTTQLLANLALAMAASFKPGDEVIVTNCDHESNIGPWTRLCALGVIVKTWKVHPDTLRLELDDLENLLTEKTRIVAFTAASNVLGTLNPIAAITQLAHRYGAQVCVDAVAYAPHRALNVQAWDVDYCVFSAYKVYGPHCSVLYGKREHLLNLTNLNHYFIANDDIPYKLQPGNSNFELSWGAAGILEYCETLAMRFFDEPAKTTYGQVTQAFEAIASHEEQLAHRLLTFLVSQPKVRVIGIESADQSQRVPTISFAVQNKHASEVVQAIDPFKIGIRSGDFYARKLIESLGLASHGGIIRVSMVHYNSLEEIDQLIKHLDSGLLG
ncbi:MAG: cysteine desulfurase-like protein [Anaerolineae bacterium]|nr:cysteine desulfurase-like protein [Gloeobacterales cyanobacterium ES-bin-313]